MPDAGLHSTSFKAVFHARKGTTADEKRLAAGNQASFSRAVCHARMRKDTAADKKQVDAGDEVPFL